MADLLTVSLSGVQAFIQCEFLYYARYILGIKRREHEVPLERGTILHDYLETYYTALAAKETAAIAHERGLVVIEATRKACNGYAELSRLGGAEDVAATFIALPDVAARLASRYYLTHGANDAMQYEVLIVEQWVDTLMVPHIRSLGKIDMATRDRHTGRVSIWEHKSTKDVPSDKVRLRDLQTLLYANQIRVEQDSHTPVIDSIVWNYLRTKEPTIPEVVKGGRLTTRKDLDSTWEVYAASLEALGEDPADPAYDAVYERLKYREHTTFFPRQEKIIVMDDNLVLRDYVAVAQTIRQRRHDWAAGISEPARTGLIGSNQRCDFCEMNAYCMAELTGGDASVLLKLKYTQKARTNGMSSRH